MSKKYYIWTQTTLFFLAFTILVLISLNRITIIFS